MNCCFCHFPLRADESLLCFGPGGWGWFHPDCAPWFDQDLLEKPAGAFQVYGDNRFAYCVRREWLLDPQVRRQVLELARRAGAGPPPEDLGLTLPDDPQEW